MWPDSTLEAIGDEIGISRQAVQQHYPQGDIKDAIAEYAVSKGKSKVIVQLIASNHPAVNDISPADRAKHLNAI